MGRNAQKIAFALDARKQEEFARSREKNEILKGLIKNQEKKNKKRTGHL
jgi:hypothetical protein